MKDNTPIVETELIGKTYVQQTDTCVESMVPTIISTIPALQYVTRGVPDEEIKTGEFAISPGKYCFVALAYDEVDNPKHNADEIEELATLVQYTVSYSISD